MSRHIPIGAALHGVGESIAWAHPEARDLIDFSTHRHFATAAERAKLDFVFYGETLSVFEAEGRIIEPYVAGRLDSLTLHAALAAITSKIGLVATSNTTYYDPVELARQYASLEALSGGRAGWNVVTSASADTSANFTAGDHVPRSERYNRAAEFVELARQLWISRPDGGVDHRGRWFDVCADAALPDNPQGRPVIMQAGESEAGRDFASANADLVFTGWNSLERAQSFYADVKRRVAGFGRAADEVKIMASAFVLVGETDASAAEEFDVVQDAMLTPAMVLSHLGRYWGRDLTGHDVNGPLPRIEPDWDVAGEYTANRIRGERDPRKAVAFLRDVAESERLSMTGLVKRLFAETMLATIVGSPSTVADRLETAVDQHAVDGFVLGTAVQPYGMDRFYDGVLPILRERGRFRDEYSGNTFRDHLGLPAR
ncbi:LLM class flavin-dependent oxidoreductase [Streptomyces umbrinus]|uniref:LLM class flavin-dependent oxidoreductase n=1 Tax=Streptomyces umbrinus TaxID=67370 RepID=UPI003C2B823F